MCWVNWDIRHYLNDEVRAVCPIGRSLVTQDATKRLECRRGLHLPSSGMDLAAPSLWIITEKEHSMELFVAVWCALFGVCSLAGCLSIVARIFALTAVTMGKLKCKCNKLSMIFYNQQSIHNYSQVFGSRGVPALDQSDDRLVAALVSDLFAASGLTGISGYVLWALLI
jgi:hypothetical protein